MAGPPVTKESQTRRRRDSEPRDRGSDRMPDAVVDAVARRSRGVCECSPGCTDRAEVLHHRRRRSAGGRHTVENIAHLSDAHHRWVHDHPAAARARGLLLAAWDPITPLHRPQEGT